MRLKRAIAAGICGLVLLAPGSACAQEIAERLRLQAGYIVQQTPPPSPLLEDFWVGAVPELIVTFNRPSYVLTASYALTAALHSLAAASEIAHRVNLTGAYELSRRTGLILSVDAQQTSVSNFLIQQQPQQANVALYPAQGTRFVTAHASQALRHELAPLWLVSQDTSASVTTTLAPAPPLDTFTFGAGGGVERLFRNDGVGVDLRGLYAITRATPPTPSITVATVTLTPRWRRDWSPTINTSVAAGATYLFSPDGERDPILTPAADATILWSYTPLTNFSLSYGAGVYPSPLTGQLLRQQRVLFHGITPISEHHRVNLGGSLGYMNGELLAGRGVAGQTFDAAFADADVTWEVSPFVQVFGRYQFIVQIGEDTTGINQSFLRDAVTVGVQLSSSSRATAVPTRFSQRLDGQDAPIRPTLPQDQQPQEEQRVEERVEGPPPMVPTVNPRNDETIVTGGSVDGLPGMWRTRPAQQPQPSQQPQQQQQQQRPTNQNNQPRPSR